MVVREPLHEFQINRLGRQPGVNQREDAMKIRTMPKIIEHRRVKLGPIFPRQMRVTISWQIHEPPSFAHREKIDQFGEPRRGRDARQLTFARQIIQQ